MIPFAAEVSQYREEDSSPILHLASLSGRRWQWGDVLMCMLTFAFDESGDDQTPLLTVAGFASSANDWEAFSVAWQARLDKDGIEFFHAADLDTFRGPFKHLAKHPDRKNMSRNLCRDLMEILKKHVYRKFAHTVINKEFASLSAEQKEQFALCAYSLAGRTCDKYARHWVASEPGFRDKPFELVFEAGAPGHGKLQKRLAQDSQTIPIFKPKKDRVLGDGTVWRGFIPLQAADWLANEGNRALQRFGDGNLESEEQLRWPMRQFLGYPPGYMGIYTAEDIHKMEKGIELQNKVIEWEVAVGLKKIKQ